MAPEQLLQDGEARINLGRPSPLTDIYRCVPSAHAPGGGGGAQARGGALPGCACCLAAALAVALGLGLMCRVGSLGVTL